MDTDEILGMMEGKPKLEDGNFNEYKESRNYIVLKMRKKTKGIMTKRLKVCSTLANNVISA